MQAVGWLQTLGWVVVVTSLCGCAGHVATLTPPLERVELTNVPFVPQTTDQCGPAALSMVLSHSGAQVDIDDLRRQVHLPDRKGSLQLELVAAARQYERIAYTFESQPDDLFGLLNDDLPVIVLQNLGVKWLPIWHYAVVVGYEPETDQLVMRSGKSERKLMRRSEFVNRWSASNYWGLVVLTPGNIPTSVQPWSYLHAVSGNEALGQSDIARVAYEAATERWSENAFTHLGLGNVHLALGAFDQAIHAYQAALRLDRANFAALNNLAYTYAENGEKFRALEMAERALSEFSPNEQAVTDLLAFKKELAEELHPPN